MKLVINGALATHFIRTQNITDVARGMPDLTLGQYLAVKDGISYLVGDSEVGFDLEDEH